MKAAKDKNFRATPTSIKLGFGKKEDLEKEGKSEKKKSQATGNNKKQEQAPPPPPPRVPRVVSSKSSFPDDDHAAGDMESGIVAAFNEAMGISLEKQVKEKLITPEAAQFIKKSTTLGDSARRTLQSISEQLSVKYPGSNFAAIHYGATKTEKLSKFWTGYGGVDNTPKSDI